VPSDDVNDSKVIENVHVSPKTASIIEDISVGSNAQIISEIRMSSYSTSDDMNEIVEVNIPVKPSKSIEFSYPGYIFMVIPTESYFIESPEFLVVIQEMVSSTFSFTGCLEFISEPN